MLERCARREALRVGVGDPCDEEARHAHDRDHARPPERGRDPLARRAEDPERQQEYRRRGQLDPEEDGDERAEGEVARAAGVERPDGGEQRQEKHGGEEGIVDVDDQRALDRERIHREQEGGQEPDRAAIGAVAEHRL